MSVGVPKGLASSGQKPITEIPHPLSAAEEPLSIALNAGGEKVPSPGGVEEVQPDTRTQDRRELYSSEHLD